MLPHTSHLHLPTAILLIAFLLGGCAPAGEENTETSTGGESTDTSTGGENSETSTGDTSSGEISNGVMVEWRDLLLAGSVTEPPPAPLGTLSLDGCVWRGPGRWEVQLSWESDIAPTPEAPAIVPIVVAYGMPAELEVDSDGPQYATALGIATLTANGSFVVPLPGSHYRTHPGWWILAPAAQFSVDTMCAAAVVDDDLGALDPDLEVTIAMEADTVTGDPPADDTIEALAATVAPTADWAAEPMAALALLSAAPNIPVDRFFLSPGTALARVEIRNLGSCIIVILDHDAGGLWQARGCTDGELDDLFDGQLVSDDEWIVQAQGPREYVEAIQSFRFLGAVDEAEAPVIGAEAAAELFGYRSSDQAEIDESLAYGWQLVGDYPWQDDTVRLRYLPDSSCCPVYNASTQNFHSGSTAKPCRDWMISFHSDGTRGFLVVVARGDRSATMTVDGEPQRIELALSQLEGVRAAVVDAPSDLIATGNYWEKIQVLEPDGSPSACVQS